MSCTATLQFSTLCTPISPTSSLLLPSHSTRTLLITFVKKSSCIRIGCRFRANVKEVILNDKPVKWCHELNYLGVIIKSASVFRCDFHNSKLKFFRSINGILGKLGSMPQINLTLKLTSTFCNPILFYGLEALHLNKTDISVLTYPYNSVFTKLFASFDKSIVTLCQFYSG